MDDCIFCRIVAGSAPSWKVHETEHAYAFLCIHPANEYHTLVIPKRHYANIFDIPADELLHLMAAVKDVVDLYHRKLGLQNVQVFNNSGHEAQQSMFHMHFHILPRERGDGQDMHRIVYLSMREHFDEWLARLK